MISLSLISPVSFEIRKRADKFSLVSCFQSLVQINLIKLNDLLLLQWMAELVQLESITL